jgi:cephalosporin-C deacetylase-like acetyl esterase
MTRRGFLSLPALGAAVYGRTPSANRAAFPGARYRPYSRCLPDYLGMLAEAAARKRDLALARLATEDAIAGRQRWARETFWRLAGGVPERTPLNARTVGAFERPAYRVEKVIYESRPNFHITANLYIPKHSDGPLPGVLFQMGHYANGKANDSYQRCCQGLVQLGYLVLAFDPMGQGERFYYPDSTKQRSRLQNPDSEHTTPGRQMLLYGDTSTRLQVWDAIRSLDYLASHPMVDPKRLASTGHSGGGTLTMLLIAADERLASAAVCMGNTENVACRPFHAPGSTDDAEQDLIASGPVGFDRWDLLYPFAPKPLLITVSDQDFYSTYSPEYISNGWQEFKRLRSIYDTLGHGSDIAWADTILPHALAYECRMQIYNWFGRSLKGDTVPVTSEPPVNPEPERTLWVTDKGSTVVSLHSETPFSLLKKGVRERQPLGLATVLVVDRPAEGLRANVLGRALSRNVRVEALDVASAPGVWVPAWLMYPAEQDPSTPVLVTLDASNREALWFQSEIDQVLPAKSPIVCAADVRGVGSLEPEFSPGAVEYTRGHQDEENYAWGSLILGKPLLGQRVTDILALIAALRRHPGLEKRPILVAASRKLTVAALCAAALDPHIEALYLAGGLVSFASIVETENYSHPFSNFVPQFLNCTDLPELLAKLAPRRVLLAGAVDGRGNALSDEAVRRACVSAATAGNLDVSGEAAWSVARLTAWALGA